MRPARRGFTLIEILVYMALAAIVLTALFFMYRSIGRDYEVTSSSYETSKALESAERWLTTDLEETALISIQRGGNGFSMVSARGGPSSNETFTISNFGTPAWQKFVFYTLVGERGGSASLVRWEQDNRVDIPWPTSTNPDDFASARPAAKQKRVIARHLAPAPDGFGLRFVRIAANGSEFLTMTHPGNYAVFNPGATDEPTHMVEVNLGLLAPGYRSQRNSLQMRFRVKVRH